VRFGEQKMKLDRRQGVGVTTELNFMHGSPNPRHALLGVDISCQKFNSSKWVKFDFVTFEFHAFLIQELNIEV
jgi:hypothetical protein